MLVVDCRFSLLEPKLGQQQYLQGHIPGAAYLNIDRDLSAPRAKHGGRHPLPETAQLAATLRALGVNSGPQATLVVAYDDSRLGFAARLWWLLRYLGHQAVQVLDGGYTGWVEAGFASSNTLPSPQSGNFQPRLQAHRQVDVDGVQALVEQGAVLVDAREAQRYRAEKEPIDPVAGHIPGAVNSPWTELTDERSYVLSIESQRQRWLQHEGRVVVSYCGSGVTACVNLLSLALIGRDDAVLYPGSWSDWCSRPELPIA